MKLLYRQALLLIIVGCYQSTAIHADPGEGISGQKPGYEVVHGWPRLPDGHILGQATGVGVDSHNHVFVFHRAGREWTDPFPAEAIEPDTISIFDGESGEQIDSWGSDMFIMPHGLTIDGRDQVWLTDVGRQQVLKFTHDGDLLMTLGEAGVAGNDSQHFNLPTDVAVLSDGSFYVSDGYENTRVIKFSASGEFLFQWGAPGSAPGEFDLPHGIAVDSNERIYVADRSNARVQVFTAEGEFITQWQSRELGRPYAVAISQDKAYVIDGGDQPETPPDRSRALEMTLDGEIAAIFGSYGNYDGQFLLGHDIAVAENGAVYVADAWGMRVQKFIQPHQD